MDSQQYNLLLSAVAISANPTLATDVNVKEQAFTLLSQFKTSNNAAGKAAAETTRRVDTDETIQTRRFDTG